MNIPTDICPLCGKTLKYKFLGIIEIYSCPTTWTNNVQVPPKEKSHYEVDTSTKGMTQHVYIPPWSIDTQSINKTSRLYKLYKKDDDTLAWEFIKSIPQILITDEKSMLERLQLLAVFL